MKTKADKLLQKNLDFRELFNYYIKEVVNRDIGENESADYYNAINDMFKVINNAYSLATLSHLATETNSKAAKNAVNKLVKKEGK